MVRRMTIAVLSVALLPAGWALSGPERAGKYPAASALATDPTAVSAPTLAALETGSDTPAKALPPLPPLPNGKSTVIGGLIGQVDPVQDILTLNVYGGHPMKVYFDERTHFFRNGVRTPLSDLRPEERASVETVLDGTDVYALSVHMLTNTPKGQCEGQVIRYNRRTGILTVQNRLSGVPVRLRVASSTKIVRAGQPTFMEHGEGVGDLRTGALTSIQFEPDNQGGGIADQISILAMPGSRFEFSGKVTYLDMHTAEVALLDPRDGNNYTVYFSPSLFPQARNLHNGSNVRITASFDGSRYLATSMTIQ